MMEGEFSVDLRNHMTVDGIEARYATIDELRMAAGNAADTDVCLRLQSAAMLREVLELRDQEIVGELIGRLEADPLDHVTIVLEMTTQQAVEEELRTGRLFHSARAGDPEDAVGTDPDTA